MCHQQTTRKSALDHARGGCHMQHMPQHTASMTTRTYPPSCLDVMTYWGANLSFRQERHVQADRDFRGLVYVYIHSMYMRQQHSYIKRKVI